GARDPQEQTHLSWSPDCDPDREGVANRRHHRIAWRANRDRRGLAPHAHIVCSESGIEETEWYREEGVRLDKRTQADAGGVPQAERPSDFGEAHEHQGFRTFRRAASVRAEPLP